ncbi:TrlF family AAA-like ATPase [Aliarcobacter cryaerophilus]|uniref:TrlF family AAA-like ATPase n=1 Tax=Aliarcobacter cryaerophilus TaxID=28198 RepID=UPI003DA5B0DD
MSFERGSEWRKWDLHFHTPSSYDYKDKSVTNQQIVDILLANNISVVAITDHHLIDVERIEELQKLAKDKITILPGIEFLADARGSQPIHFIGIFGENCNLKYIWGQLENKTALNKINGANKQINEVYCDLEDTIKLIHELGGIITIHAGNKHGSIEHITHSLPHTQAQKTDIANIIDFYELGKIEDEDGYIKYVFPAIKKYIPMIICSDNHDIKNYTFKGNCWIKANPTFEGLVQAINEPKDRVFIGDIPPKLKLVQLNKDKFIENIEINKTSESKLVDKWFENTNSIPLNSGLIAIIGNKGNGKSALADIIALSGNVKLPDGDWFSFLNKKRFKDKLSLASNFESKLTWLNNTIEIVNLNDTIPEESIEKVKYLPQKYIEKICNEDEYNSFQNEINKVVFSHIKQEDRLDKNNLYDLIKIKTEVESNERENLLKDLKQILQDNEDLKVKYSDIELKKLENLLADKNQQIKDHKLNKELIVVVSDPTVDQELQGEIKTKFEESRLIINQINNLQKELVDIQSLLNTESIKKNTIEIVTGEIDILVLQFQKTMEEKQLKLKDSELEIDINSVLKIHYEKSILTRELEKVKKVISDNNELKNKKSQEINTLKENKTKLDSELSEPQKEYQDYLEKIKLWESKNIELLNEKAIIEKEINFSKTELPIKLEEHELAKAYVIDKIYSTYERELEIFKELYSSVLEFVLNEKEKLGSTSFVDFTTQIIMDKNMLIDSLISFFDGRRQQFKEEDLKELVAKYSDDIKLDNLKEMFIELLQVIERNKPLNQQFKDGKQLADFYLELLGLKYLKVEYDILFDNKNIKQLSPGERGALLIIFYLLIDKGDIPLIIDQPEDNLDNESVFEYLVPYIKQAKQRRQIIIVTHNPNIAVVADAEQVIYTELDKANGNQIKYITGAIEDKEINKQIVKVLEGTMPAFDNRTVKYYRN